MLTFFLKRFGANGIVVPFKRRKKKTEPTEVPSIRVTPNSQQMSVEEYLLYESAADTRHEYVRGFVREMEEVSEAHNTIVVNLVAAIQPHLRDKNCKVYGGNFKLRIPVKEEDIFFYPDVMVARSGAGTEEYYLRNPKMIVEVLAANSKTIDWREKSLFYMTIRSLEEYVFVLEHRYAVINFRRDDNWKPHILESREATVEFRSIQLSLTVAQIYEHVVADDVSA